MTKDEETISIPVKITGLQEWAEVVDQRIGEIGNALLILESKTEMLMELICNLHDIDLGEIKKKTQS